MQIQDHPLSSARVRRQYLGISSALMARRLGIQRTSYLRFERGERRAYLDHAHAIAAMLGCTVDQLRQLPTVEEVRELYARANPTPPGEPVGAQPEPDQPACTVVDAQRTETTETAPIGTSSNDVAAMIETWDND